MASSPIRYKKLIEELPKHNYAVAPAARAAGFSSSTADKSGKRLIKAATKYQAQEILDTIDGKSMSEVKSTMAQIVGMSREEIMSSLKKIATQDRDYGSALKVLAPLAKEQGVVLAEDNAQINVPVLNVTVKERNTIPQLSNQTIVDAEVQSIDGLTEPEQ